MSKFRGDDALAYLRAEQEKYRTQVVEMGKQVRATQKQMDEFREKMLNEPGECGRVAPLINYSKVNQMYVRRVLTYGQRIKSMRERNRKPRATLILLYRVAMSELLTCAMRYAPEFFAGNLFGERQMDQAIANFDEDDGLSDDYEDRLMGGLSDESD